MVIYGSQRWAWRMPRKYPGGAFHNWNVSNNTYYGEHGLVHCPCDSIRHYSHQRRERGQWHLRSLRREHRDVREHLYTTGTNTGANDNDDAIEVQGDCDATNTNLWNNCPITPRFRHTRGSTTGTGNEAFSDGHAKGLQIFGLKYIKNIYDPVMLRDFFSYIETGSHKLVGSGPYLREKNLWGVRLYRNSSS